MRNFYLLVLLVPLLLGSCKKNKNTFIIPRNTFKEILIDLHIADGIYMMNYGKYTIHNDSVNFYNAIFKKYGYTRQNFDSTLRYYTIYPKKFDIIYDEVVNRLNILEQQVSLFRNFENESVNNLYKGKTKWELPQNSEYTRVPFDIPINDSAEYTINVYAKIYPDDQSKNLRITAYFWFKDSISNKWKMDNFPEANYSIDKYFNLFSTSKRYNSRQNGRLRGWILDNDNSKSRLFKKHIDIKMIYIEKKKLFNKK